MNAKQATLKAMIREYELVKMWLDSAETTEERLEHAMDIIDLLTRALAISTHTAHEAASTAGSAMDSANSAIDSAELSVGLFYLAKLVFEEHQGEA